MIKIYKTKNNITEEIKDIEVNSWINLYNPTDEELEKIASLVNTDKDYLKRFLDEEEQARIDTEDDIKLIVIDVPTYERNKVHTLSVTLPLIIIHVKDYFITMCTKNLNVFNDFISGKIKDFDTAKKSRFTLLLLFKTATMYINELKIINDQTSRIEQSLKRSTNNAHLLKLMDLQKSLVYFTTSLKSNESVLDRLQKINIMQMYEEDMDILEDVIIEHRQASEMASIYSSILSSTIEVFGTIISNNLNNVMKILASITIVVAIPTTVSSFMGMNVPLGSLQNNEYSFLIILLISVILSIIVAWILRKKNML